MKKILIVSNSDTSKYFLDRVLETYISDNMYYIIEAKAKNYKDVNPSRFKFYEFDPTNFYKLSNLLKMDFTQIIVLMDDMLEMQYILKNIRTVRKTVRIIVLNKWSIENEDPNTVFINSDEILAQKLLNYLPNVPIIAQNIGMGEGEIMEVLVPFGSSFVYRHIGVIEQKDWRIVAIYRNKKLIFPNRRRMIQPNDLLLLMGEPAVLKSVYLAIKRELGQFPEPFGSNIYLYIDMNLLNLESAEKLVRRAMLIHEKLGKKLIIKIVNPGHIETIWKIKEYRSSEVIVDIEYAFENLKERFLSDIKTLHIGLVIVSKEHFRDEKSRQTLYEANVPVFKIADKALSSIKDVSIILGEDREIENISSTIFDASAQMGLNIELYNYLNEHQEEKEQVIEHFNNLSSIFSKSIKVVQGSENPIKALRKRDNFIQILSFSKSITESRLSSLLSTNSEKLYYKFDDYHQIFIPTQM
ncbi:TrkA C-terminal domain-containing protein [Sulfurimonas sp.]|uniref:COG3400 family protein n=1 Tax=Sulfurimonas sp. TaxID=2022749 RepID=UPI0025D24162|nr:TrkA C-terminal domain-containing protein [Sulfurimonas sp.]MDD5157036.1 TrkA C-terminal domain-containing protein [Sulfurimonas sp.]